MYGGIFTEVSKLKRLSDHSTGTHPFVTSNSMHPLK
jgi:hypothetical protein